MAFWRTGLENNPNHASKRTNISLSATSNLSMATWNCGGLSKIKKDLCSELNYDALCLTETHGWRDDDPLTIYSDSPDKNDSWSGVAIVISQRVSKYIIGSGSIGSRITYVRLRGTACNILIVGVYIPQKCRNKPDQKETYGQLESFLMRTGRRDCIILMGDFNSRLSRNTDHRVGKWCIHSRMDSGGERLLQLMNKISMRCVSTYFQPHRKQSNATYMNIQPEKAPSQIDHVIVSSRWSSAIHDCKVKWGPSIKAYGRKYDHGLISFQFKIKLKCDRRTKRKDFRALKSPEVSLAHNKSISENFSKSERPASTTEQYVRINKVMTSAQEVLPNVPAQARQKWNSSESTKKLVEQRAAQWDKMAPAQRKAVNKEISRSAKNDYRLYVEGVLCDIEQANSAGNTTEVFKHAKQLSSRGEGNRFVQPILDNNGDPITTTEQQHQLWADFLEQKFAAIPNDPEVDLSDIPGEPLPAKFTLEEMKECVKKLKTGKACGPDKVPVEQYKSSDEATTELFHLLDNIWETEDVPDDFVSAEMLMFYKKKCKNDRKNYRALGLLNHAYKIFAMLLLMHILPFITPKLSEMQAGFCKGRSCRDNILILVMTVNHLLKEAEQGISKGVIAYIDFTAAFDSISHSFLLQSLRDYEVPTKYCRLVQAIYQSAAVKVRLQEPGGHRTYSRQVNIRRGVIQGDIPSPVCFLVALDKLLKDYGQLDQGLQLTETLSISELAYADDCALPSDNTVTTTSRLNNLDTHCRSKAGMEISKPKTKVQHIMNQPKMSETTEDDIANLPPEKQFKFPCDKCGRTFPSKHGLAVHKGRWCKKRKTAKQPSRKGTVADRIIQKIKVDKHQQTLPTTKIGDEELENVYAFAYLGAEIAADGNPEITIRHRINIAWGRFGEYRHVLTSTKLPVGIRVRLYVALIVMTLTYACGAWLFTDDLKKKLNGVNSKMLSQITKRSIHQEAANPTFNTVDFVMQQRWEYLGHILRMDHYRATRRFLIELSPSNPPYIDGSLFADAPHRTVQELTELASDRDLWWKSRAQMQGL